MAELVSFIHFPFTNCQILQYAGSAWDELKHICQAVGFLVRNYLVLSNRELGKFVIN
jgi:hypothetical protein